MTDIFELLLSVACLVSGTGFLVYGRHKGRSWWEAFQPTALLFGIGVLSGSDFFLTGAIERIVSWGFFVPALAISLHHSRQLVGQRRVALMPTPEGELGDGVELAVFRANLSDFEESNRKLRLRSVTMAVVGSAPILGLGVIYGSWPLVLTGGALMLSIGLMGKWITKPLKQSPKSSLQSEEELPQIKA